MRSKQLLAMIQTLMNLITFLITSGIDLGEQASTEATPEETPERKTKKDKKRKGKGRKGKRAKTPETHGADVCGINTRSGKPSKGKGCGRSWDAEGGRNGYRCGDCKAKKGKDKGSKATKASAPSTDNPAAYLAALLAQVSNANQLAEQAEQGRTRITGQPLKDCTECGEEFLPKVSHQLRCDEECRVKHNRRRMQRARGKALGWGLLALLPALAGVI